jgi:hypothetical protein
LDVPCAGGKPRRAILCRFGGVAPIDERCNLQRGCSMQMGLLWFDSDPGRDVAAKARDAARRYRERFGTSPDTCYVSTEAWSEERLIPLEVGGGSTLRVVPAGNILMHHFWVGIEERREPTAA